MYPYLDVLGFRRRSTMPSAKIDALDAREKGWIQKRIMAWSSRLNAQLRKRYGNAPNVGNSLPLGQKPPTFVSVGTTPPALTLTGVPQLGSLEIVLQCTTAGAVGTAVFSWSRDGGRSFTAGLASASTMLLYGTGLSVVVPAGAVFAVDNVYTADPPVLEVVLDWISILVTWDCWVKDGRNPADPTMADMKEDRERVLAEFDKVADGKDGLFDLPITEGQDSAVTTAGPLAYTEASPYVSADRQERDALWEDAAGFGTFT